MFSVIYYLEFNYILRQKTSKMLIQQEGSTSDNSETLRPN